ncbi:MAG TPA: hypothetical protein VEI98_04185 [Xanthobacteraceae bacterium]|nr:hypothetical protein [Xanthobacteraceae bacterium]
MNDGATSADLRRFDKTRPQQRHRNVCKIEIEQNARRHEKRACQKFAKIAVLPSEIEAPESRDDSCSDVEGKYHGFSAAFVASTHKQDTAVRSGRRCNNI